MGGGAMAEGKLTADRPAAYSDAVDEQAFSALWPLWPTAMSYAVSYLFIAIIWINHHHLWQFVGPPALGLIWINFMHLFLVSLLPFATAWVARTRLASPPVVLYVGLFVCIDIAYNVFERLALSQTDESRVSPRMRRLARRRSLAVLAGFCAATLVAVAAPRIGFGMICGASSTFGPMSPAAGDPTTPLVS